MCDSIVSNDVPPLTFALSYTLSLAMRSMSGINARILKRAQSAACFARGFALPVITSTDYRLVLSIFAGEVDIDVMILSPNVY